jgi:Ca-activated chloride channel family protein
MHELKPRILFLLFSFLIAFPTFGQLQREANEAQPTTRILFLLDASGSMLAPWEETNRINKAKEILLSLIDSLRSVPKTEVGLRIYGHQYNKKYQNCKDTKLEVPFSGDNFEQVKTTLDNILPKGVTPLAYSLEQAANDFTASRKYRNLIIIITDGLESCGGDPCAVSLALQRKHIFLRPFIIGMGVDKDLAPEFKCIGEFYNAQNSEKLKKVLQKAVQQSLKKSQLIVELLDESRKPTETNVNVSFINTFTGVTEYDYVHQLRPNGTPYPMEVDPVLTYDIRVNTIPPAYKKDLFITKESQTIKIPAAQGSLRLRQRGADEYDHLKAIVYSDNGRYLHDLEMNHEEKFLTGKYKIRVLTVPELEFTVTIKQSEETIVDLDAPGKLSISENYIGFGSIYQLDANHNSTWVYQVDRKSSRTNMAMQPGNYKLVFRSKDATGVIHTSVKFFEIRSGAVTSVKLF